MIGFKGTLRFLFVNMMTLSVASTSYAGLFDNLLPKKTDWTSAMVQAFQFQCSTFGAQANAAIAQTEDLKSLLESIKTDPQCSALNADLNALITAQTNMSRVLADQSHSDSLGTLQNDMASLITAYSTETDASVKASLASEIAMRKVDLANFSSDARTAHQQDIYNATIDFTNYLNKASATLSTASSCANKHNDLGIQVATQLAMIGAAAFSNQVGALVYVGASAADDLVKYLSDRKYNQGIKKLRSIEAGNALGCAIELASRNWCHARDVKNILTYSPLQQKPTDNPHWSAFKLNSTYLSQLNSWIGRLVAGSPATDKYNAKMKMDADDLQNSLQKAKQGIDAAFGTYQKLEDAQDTEKGKNTVRFQLVGAIVAAMNNSSSEGGSNWEYNGIQSNSAYVQFFAFESSCATADYFFSGKTEKQTHGSNETCDANYVGPWPQIATLKEYADFASQQATKDVANIVSLGKETDFTSVLADYAISKKANLPTPEITLRNVNTFLMMLKKDYNGQIPPVIMASIDELLGKIKQVHDVIYEVTPQDQKTGSVTDPNQQRISTLALTLAPDGDESYLQRKIEDLIHFDFQLKLNNGEFVDQISLVYQDTVGDAMNFDNGIGISPVKVQQDSDTAQQISKGNIQVIASTFLDQIADVLTDMNKNKDDSGAFQHGIQMLCSQLLAVDPATLKSNSKIMSVCHGQILNDQFVTFKNAVDFDQVIDSEKTEDRICAVYDYFRLDEIFGIKASGGSTRH